MVFWWWACKTGQRLGGVMHTLGLDGVHLLPEVPSRVAPGKDLGKGPFFDVSPGVDGALRLWWTRVLR